MGWARPDSFTFQKIVSLTGYLIMSDSRNIPKITGGIIDLNRAQIEHRASWLALIFDEAKKENINIEVITRRAMRRMGRIHGLLYKSASESFVSFADFKKSFLNGLAVKTFEMDQIEANDHELIVEFHYCPLLSAWSKLGFSDERCAELCDIAMDGDRGIADSMGYKLVLTDTIALGCETCKIRFIRNEK